MGRARTEPNAGLPPGMLRRMRRGSQHYYLSMAVSGPGRREEVPLGNDLAEALKQYGHLTARPALPLVNFAEAARALHAQSRKGARQRGIAFELEVQQIEALLRQTGGCCAITGISFDLGRAEGARRRMWAPSIDRVDSSVGYVPGNVRVIAGAVNIAMNEFGEEFLVRIAQAILRRRKRDRG